MAITDGRVVGFTDLDDDGYVDMLFVDPDFGRQGVATSMLAATIALARQRGTVALTTYARLTAMPLFERHGLRSYRGAALPLSRCRVAQRRDALRTGSCGSSSR